jgi:prepilin-type processing-associated H-X9-DG protein
MGKPISTFRSCIHWVAFGFLALVLASILWPWHMGTLGYAHRTPAASNLAQIAKTYATYSNGSTNGRNIQLPPGSTAHDAAFILAKYADLNDASMWFNPSDNALAGVTIPKSVIAGDGNSTTAPFLNPAFANVTLSVVFAANVSTSAPTTTTPIAWTRGLQPNGTWSADSPWQGRGGHIAFLDGHVSWYDSPLDTKEPDNSLVTAPGWPNPGTPTANITLALPPGAIILPAEPNHRANP